MLFLTPPLFVFVLTGVDVDSFLGVLFLIGRTELLSFVFLIELFLIGLTEFEVFLVPL